IGDDGVVMLGAIDSTEEDLTGALGQMLVEVGHAWMANSAAEGTDMARSRSEGNAEVAERAASVSLAGTMRGGNLYGWQAIGGQRARAPKLRRMAVVEFDCQYVKAAQDEAPDAPVVRLVQVEPVDGDDATMVRNLMAERHAARGGQLTLDQADPREDA